MAQPTLVPRRHPSITTLMKQLTTIASLLCAIALIGCSSPTSNPTADVKMVDGQAVNILGRAVELPNHAEKSNGIGIDTGQDKLLFAGDFRPFPAKVLGAQIRVKGVVRQKRLPMFHYEPGDESPPQGIPVPPGTDIAKESIYYVIENPAWELVKP